MHKNYRRKQVRSFKGKQYKPDVWSRRPCKRGCVLGQFAKLLTHRAERREARQLVRDELQLYYVTKENQNVETSRYAA